MSPELTAAVERLTTTYMSLAQAAVGYKDTLSSTEVYAEWAKAVPDSAEYVALNCLLGLFATRATDEPVIFDEPEAVVQEVIAPIVPALPASDADSSKE